MHWQTHTVFNQPTPLNNSNLFLSDTALREAVVREGAGWDGDLLASIGQQLGTAESLELGRLANSNPPELLRYDATGARLDDVRFHPAWHLLMQGLCANRVHNLAWQEDAREGAFVARAARFLLHAQVEAGTLCPITMTFAATPLLQHALPAPFRDWLSPLLSDRYDPHLAPGGQKRGLRASDAARLVRKERDAADAAFHIMPRGRSEPVAVNDLEQRARRLGLQLGSDAGN